MAWSISAATTRTTTSGANVAVKAGIGFRCCRSSVKRKTRPAVRMNSTDTVEFILTAGLVFRFTEERQHRIPIPAFTATLAPLVVVRVVAADIDHAIDRA